MLTRQGTLRLGPTPWNLFDSPMIQRWAAGFTDVTIHLDRNSIVTAAEGFHRFLVTHCSAVQAITISADAWLNGRPDSSASQVSCELAATASSAQYLYYRHMLPTVPFSAWLREVEVDRDRGRTLRLCPADLEKFVALLLHCPWLEWASVELGRSESIELRDLRLPDQRSVRGCWVLHLSFIMNRSTSLILSWLLPPRSFVLSLSIEAEGPGVSDVLLPILKDTVQPQDQIKLSLSGILTVAPQQALGWILAAEAVLSLDVQRIISLPCARLLQLTFQPAYAALGSVCAEVEWSALAGASRVRIRAHHPGQDLRLVGDTAALFDSPFPWQLKIRGMRVIYGLPSGPVSADVVMQNAAADHEGWT